MKGLTTTAALAAWAGLLIWPLASVAQGRSQTQWESLVRIKLGAVALLLNLVDAHLAYDPYVGRLQNNTYTDLIVTLHQGVDYALVGVCDNDCRDMDLKLYNEEGDLVVKDTAPDSTPAVEIVPRRTQDFRVRVLMEKCSDNPCYYGLGVYQANAR
jgi:hypothetical protein